MLKRPKTQTFLLISLGIMVLGHIGYVFYKGQTFPASSMAASEVRTKAAKLPEEKHFQVENVKELKAVFDQHDFNLKKAKSEGKVPHLYLAKLPKDMRKTEKKPSKATFIQVVLPLVLKVNQEILLDREKLLAMQERLKKGAHLRQAEKMWLAKLASEYRCKSTKIESLLVHVDVIPPSLALAQGILESGWGTSPAAIHKNSTFGHMRTKKDVASFETLHHNVKAYVHNLNRHSAYASFRRERSALRSRNETLWTSLSRRPQKILCKRRRLYPGHKTFNPEP